MATKSTGTKTKADLSAEVRDLQHRLAVLENVDRERRQAFEALRASEEKYRVLLDESSDPIFTFFPDGEYRYVNRAFAIGLGRAPADIIGKKIWDMFPSAEADKRFAVVKWVFENGEPKNIEVRVPRPGGDLYYITTVKPIIEESGRVVSVICISKEITERKAMEDRLTYMAQYDALTDLPNRTLFGDRVRQAISQAKRDQTRLGLMFVDLDRFKPVNDSYGHQVGDILLRTVAQRLKEVVRESDTVGRIGGDEFVILLPSVEAATDALLVAEKVRAALHQPFDLPGYPRLDISASIGVAIYPDHGSEEIHLAKNADDAMYRAKAAGRNGVQLAKL